MVTLDDIRKSGDLSGVEEIVVDDIRLLWHSNFWDGILSGMLNYNEKKYWFECIDQTVYGGKRQFAVIDLTQEQLMVEEKWHQLFRDNVGTHCDYDENGQRDFGEVKPQHLHKLYYEPFKAFRKENPKDYSYNKVMVFFKEK